MKKPSNPHPTPPGEMLTEEYLKPMNITQVQLAKEVGVSHRTINEICTAKRALSPKIALLFAAYFQTTPEYWLNMQMACDLWKEWEKFQKKKRAS